MIDGIDPIEIESIQRNHQPAANLPSSERPLDAKVAAHMREDPLEKIERRVADQRALLDATTQHYEDLRLRGPAYLPNLDRLNTPAEVIGSFGLSLVKGYGQIKNLRGDLAQMEAILGQRQAAQREEESAAARPMDLNPRHFAFTDEQQRTGGFSAATRARENIAAIRVLKALQSEGREATDEERSTMARYCGWGGLPGVFVEPSSPKSWLPVTDKRQHWERETHEALKELCTPDELHAITLSTLNAHYTSPQVVQAVWRAIERAGFKGGRMLEPSVGIGSFLGYAPPELMTRTKIAAVDKDPLAGAMAAHLFPDAVVQVLGYEEAKFPSKYFDLAVSNIPFGSFGVFDTDYNRHKLMIHDYFVCKMLDQVKPGGVVAVITSAGTLNKLDPKARRLMHERGELLGVVRLPTDAFDAQANTRVTTDVMLFRRREHDLAHGSVADEDLPDWTRAERKLIAELPDPNAEDDAFFKKVSFPVTTYFDTRPTQQLGTPYADQGMGGRDTLSVQAHDDQDFDAAFDAALDGFLPPLDSHAQNQADTDTITVPDYDDEPTTLTIAVDDTRLGEGSLVSMPGGQVGRLTGREIDGNPVVDLIEISGKPLARLQGQIAVRDAMNRVFETQIRLGEDDSVEYLQARSELNRTYDAFVAAHGPLNLSANRAVFRADPEAGRLASLEHFNAEAGTATKSDIFHVRILGLPPKPKVIENATDALAVSLAQTGGRVNLALVTAIRLQSKEVTPDQIETVRQELHDAGRIFRNPQGDSWEIADRYLSGHVRDKLAVAREAAKLDETFHHNVRALEPVIPADLGPGEIFVRIGSPWIPPEDFKEFITETLEAASDDVTVRFIEGSGQWDIEGSYDACRSVQAKTTWGTPDRDAFDILNRLALNRKMDVTRSAKGSDGTTTTWVDTEATMQAEQKAEELEQAFSAWVWKDSARADRLSRSYNERHNGFVVPTYDGSHLTFPGMSRAIEMRPFQKDAIWRALVEQKVLLAHEVGTGKTFVQIAIAMEAKRLGLCDKPLQIVPNHMIEQFEREARQLYPNARILSVSKDDLTREGSDLFRGKVANNNWDLVIMTHSQFSRTSLPVDFLERYRNESLAKLKAATVEVGDDTAGSTKRLARRIVKMESDFDAMLDRSKKDDGITLDDMGVDWLLVDEAHNFKNLDAQVVPSAVESGIQGSQRALSLFLNTRWMYEHRRDTPPSHAYAGADLFQAIRDDIRAGNTGVVFATGTPISNNIFEAYVLGVYLEPEMLDKAGTLSLDAWANTFLRQRTQWEPDPAGTGFKRRSRYQLENGPELIKGLSQVMDVKTAEDAGIKRPELKTIQIESLMSDDQAEMMADLARRALRIRSEKVDPKEDNLLKIVSEGRKLGLDPRLLDPSLPDHPDYKANRCATEVLRIYSETRDTRATQMIFCEQGVPGSKNHGVYQDLKDKLVAGGMKPEEVRFIHEFDTDAKKATAFADMRTGKIAVLIGSTPKMGEGTNVQARMKALHHLDPPWRPSDIRQRDGRIQRQGNRFDEVERYIYTTKDTFDLFMWNLMRMKADQFDRIMKGDPSVRSFNDAVDPTFGETVAITTGNPMIRRKIEVDDEVRRLSILRAAHMNTNLRTWREIGRRNGEIERRENVLAFLGWCTKDRQPDAGWSVDLTRHAIQPKLSKREGVPPEVIPEQAQGEREEVRPWLARIAEQLYRKQLEERPPGSPAPATDYLNFGGVTYRGLPVETTVEVRMDPETHTPRFSTYFALDGRSLPAFAATGALDLKDLNEWDRKWFPATQFANMAGVETGVDGYQASVANHNREIAVLQDEVARLRIEHAKPFDFDARLVELQVEQRELNAAIEAADANQPPSDSKAEGPVRQRGEELVMAPDDEFLEEREFEIAAESHSP